MRGAVIVAMSMGAVLCPLLCLLRLLVQEQPHLKDVDHRQDPDEEEEQRKEETKGTDIQ
jgi:hypothetical protein